MIIITKKYFMTILRIIYDDMEKMIKQNTPI